ncbi:MAG: hypothetical protein SPL13_01205 [Clostridia bacterium]|nr:hypothetical protein [Clostridia bacterium]
MKSLLDCVNSLDLRKTYYYRKSGKRYEEAILKSYEFINDYFYAGGKLHFLSESITDIRNFDLERCKHVVNTYYLGLYLLEKIDYLQIKKPLFSNKKDYLWAWFLCSLYHDAFFNERNEPNIVCSFGYENHSKRLLYSADTLQKYYWKNINRKTSYNGDVIYNHGIVGAEALYQNFIKDLENHIREGFCSLEGFLNNGAIMHDCNRLVSYKSYVAMCKVAKVIASHAVFIAEEDNKQKYLDAGLGCLVPTAHKSIRMPKEKKSLNEYEKLYYILSLVDNIEPTKNGIAMQDVFIDIVKIDNKSYSMIIKIIALKDKTEDYLNNLKNLSNWLSYVECSEVNSNTVELKFVF